MIYWSGIRYGCYYQSCECRVCVCVLCVCVSLLIMAHVHTLDCTAAMKHGCHASFWRSCKLDRLHSKLQVGQGFKWGQPCRARTRGWAREDSPLGVQVINDCLWQILPVFLLQFCHLEVSCGSLCVNVKERDCEVVSETPRDNSIFLFDWLFWLSSWKMKNKEKMFFFSICIHTLILPLFLLHLAFLCN